MIEKRLKEILEELKKARKRWCRETVDDAEDMWSEIPELLAYAVPAMEEALELPSSVLEINSAMYGTDNVLKNVTDAVKEYVVGDHLELKVDNSNLGGDPVPGQVKTLTVTYSYRGKIECIGAREQQMLRINCEPL